MCGFPRLDSDRDAVHTLDHASNMTAASFTSIAPFDPGKSINSSNRRSPTERHIAIDPTAVEREIPEAARALHLTMMEIDGTLHRQAMIGPNLKGCSAHGSECTANQGLPLSFVGGALTLHCRCLVPLGSWRGSDCLCLWPTGVTELVPIRPLEDRGEVETLQEGTQIHRQRGPAQRATPSRPGSPFLGHPHRAR